MTTIDFLSTLRQQGIEVWADGDKLRFSAPQGALTPELRAELGNRKRDVLTFLREASGVSRYTLPPIQLVARDRALPLSFPQQRLWFLDHLEPGLPTYNFPVAVRLTGTLDEVALERALKEIVRRHEAVRTVFSGSDAVQIITPFDSSQKFLQSAVVDSESAARDLVLREARRPFDLKTGPLIRGLLIKVADTDHILLITTHHIVSDGWSMGVLVGEILTLYGDFVFGRFPSLPELSVQYADFACWQREQLQGDVFQKQLAYWKQNLAGYLPALELPTDYPRKAVQTSPGARLYWDLPKPLALKLIEFSRNEGVTLFMTLLAAYDVLLYRYTGQEDMLVGSPIANRLRPELEGLIGFFVNTLVMRTDLSGTPTFRDLLRRVRETALGAYAHQDLPFEKLVEELQPNRDLSRSPIFQVMFALQNAPVPQMDLPDLTAAPMEIDGGGAPYEISIHVREEPTAVSGFIEYNTDLFSPDRIERLLGHWLTLLAGIVEQPDLPIAELPLLTEQEQGQILGDWNQTQRTFPPPYTLHECVEARAAACPETVAVVFEDGHGNNSRLMYAELNRRANQLANTLIAGGVGPDVHIGLYLDRSLDMLVAMLGVLKAGGTYIPLDPAYPMDRIAYMLADSGAELVLTQANLVAKLPSQRVLCLDADWDTMAQVSDANPQRNIPCDTAAYMIYTSGSTGKPKGVRISHQSTVNFLHSMRQEPGLSADDRLLAVTTLSFDIAVLELWLPLIVGAQIILADRAVAGDAYLLRDALTRWNVTVMQATPATWRLLLASGWDGKSDLRILCGGEAFPRDLADALLVRSESVWNMYGPTETTVWSAVSRVTPDSGPVPVGRPIANTQFYVLDHQLQLLPVGIPGELFIGGDGLALGYWQRADLTAEKFIPSPFYPSERLYRTGDLVCYRPDGLLTFFGRLDHQVKVRGFRIELGEIESVVGQVPGVRQVVVSAREDTPGDKRLVAYVVADHLLTVSDLRAFAQHSLPEYMVPSTVVFLDSLPLTPNGKVNRLALPAPDQSRPDLKAEYVMPRNEIEQMVAGIWQVVLGVDKVGVFDNFFDLGGHSLLMVQAHIRLQEALQREFSMMDLFKYPTIHLLSQHLCGEQDTTVQLVQREKLDDGKQRLKQRLNQRKQRS